MGKRVLYTVLPVFIVGVLLATSCAGMQVDIQGATQSSSLSIGQSEHNKASVAIIGVDFDPPLDYVETTRMQGITLLVAVENRGSERIDGARIRARLKAGERNTKMFQRVGVLPDLPPHTVVVYRFPRLRNIPVRRGYVLDISIQTKDGQQVLAHRSYRIRVKNAER